MKYKLLIVFVLFSAGLRAQKAETTRLFKQFVSVCNAYKQLPLQLTVGYKKTSNIPLDGTDSSLAEGVFYIQQGGAYINFGGVEQILTDTLALVVMNSINQMILSENNMEIASRVNAMVNMPVRDSSVVNFSQKYTIHQIKSANLATAVLEITNRNKLRGTELPAEIITVIYNVQDNNPQKIKTVTRSLIKKSADLSPGISVATVSIPEKGDYLVKEDVTEYVYEIIAHEKDKKMPALLSDRLEKDSLGHYVPTKNYQHYKLVLN